MNGVETLPVRSPASWAFAVSTAGLSLLGLAAALHGDLGTRGIVTLALCWSTIATTGVRPSYFRPPLGQTSLTTVRGVRAVGVTLLGWSSRGFDGLRSQTPDAVVDRVRRTLDDGAIVMLHDAAEHDGFEPASIAALPRLLAVLDARGFTSVGIDALLRHPL